VPKLADAHFSMGNLFLSGSSTLVLLLPEEIGFDEFI
jgi:hypothetical protein